MIFTKEKILKIEKETNYQRNNIEKVIRLINVLEFIYTRSKFKDVLVLKGGTAINLIHTNLKRLSLDIDLDYHGSLDKVKTFKDRDEISKELDEFMFSQDYIKAESHNSYALLSKKYFYINVSGAKESIKVEINFMDRISLYGTIDVEINQFGTSLIIKTLTKVELYGMKIAALINRGKPRDLFDGDEMFNQIDTFDKEKLRNAAIFYLSLDSMLEFNDELYKAIRKIIYYEIKIELLSVLTKGYKLNLEEMKGRTINNLKEFLILDDNHLTYLKEFSKGNYDPYLLFDEEVASRAIKHPMAKWKVLNINKE